MRAGQRRTGGSSRYSGGWLPGWLRSAALGRPLAFLPLGRRRRLGLRLTPSLESSLLLV